jgi:hypothetical protein
LPTCCDQAKYLEDIHDRTSQTRPGPGFLWRTLTTLKEKWEDC